MLKSLAKKLTPAKLQFRLVSLKHTFSKFKQEHYAQNCEDVMARSLFPKGYKGFYVDVGAHHPYRISNTYLLFKQGWNGINIDANPETITLFKKARPQDINLNVGVSGKEESLTYHKFSDPAVNTFDKSHAERFKQKNWIAYLGSTAVATKPLKAILDEHLPNNQKIDVLSVDVEEFDLIALKSNDWDKYQPKVIIVEEHNFDLDNSSNSPIYEFLKQKGYGLKYVVGFSLIFKLQENLS